MKKEHLSAIMKKAWELRYRYAVRMRCPVGEVWMAECLREAWECYRAWKARQEQKQARVQLRKNKDACLQICREYNIRPTMQAKLLPATQLEKIARRWQMKKSPDILEKHGLVPAPPPPSEKVMQEVAADEREMLESGVSITHVVA